MLARMWRKGNPCTLLVKCKLVQPLWKTMWRFLNNLNIELPYNPAIPLQGIYPKELKTSIQADICAKAFIKALFSIAKR